MPPNDEEESDDDDNRRTDQIDIEEFHSANEEVEDSNPEQSSRYPCGQCPEVWGSKAALKFHRRTAHHKMGSKELLTPQVKDSNPKQSSNYQCSQCTEVKESKAARRRHMRQYHRKMDSSVPTPHNEDSNPEPDLEECLLCLGPCDCKSLC